jgi:hypothetical protein
MPRVAASVLLVASVGLVNVAAQAPEVVAPETAPPEPAAPATPPSDAAAQPAAPAGAPAARNEFHGTVSLGRNRPVVGATVLVMHESDATRTVVTVTDARGAFKLAGLPDGRYRVLVTRDGLAPVIKSGVEMRFPFRALLEIPMQPGAAEVAGASSPAAPGEVSLSGRVVDRHGRPIGDAVLELRPVAPSDPRRELTTGEGRVEIGQVPAGRWRLELRAVGFLTLRTVLDLGASTTLEAVMVEQPPDYVPGPLDLMPPELPIPPAGFDIGAGPSYRPEARTA